MDHVYPKLQTLENTLPDDASITISLPRLRQLVEDFASDEDRPDLTISDVAEQTGRAISTVRNWIAAGDLKTYKFNNRQRRVRREDLRAFLDKQRGDQEDAD